MTAPVLGTVPIYFGAADRPLFGFFHPAAGASRRAVGVVLCSPIGEDMIRAHRAFRHLAEKLAAAGFPVLRFDFDGTGDSVGDERDADRVATWRADVGRAAAELKARAGVEQLAFVGLRMGATLAALAAADLGGVDARVLWGAYGNGGTFVNEQTRAHKMHAMLEPTSFSGGPAATDGQEALGFLLTPQTATDLGGLELVATTRSPARRTLVIDTANVPSANALVGHLRSLGSAVTARHMPGQKFLITSPNNAEVPVAHIDAIVAWMIEDAATVDAVKPAPAAGAPVEAHAAKLRERAVVFGKRGPLFGVLSNPPAEIQRTDLPGIIILNAGTVHRIGAHRLSVTLARRWAALGFHVLRMDLSGIGDSPAADGNRENLSYPPGGRDDVRAAMDFLAERFKLMKFIVTGVCSGADVAFHAGFDEPRTAGVMLLNPRTFCITDLKTINTYQHARWYQGSLLRTQSWLKLLRGDVDIARAVRIVAPNVKDVVLRRAKRTIDGLLGSARGGAAAPDQTTELDVPKCLNAMATRGVDTFLLVTENDPGVDYLESNYGNDMRLLAALPSFHRTDIRGTDNTFTARWAQDQVAQVLTEHLKQRFLAARAA